MKSRLITSINLSCAIFNIALLCACGGGGGGTSDTPTSVQPSSTAASSVAPSSSSATSSSVPTAALKTLTNFPIGVAVSNTDSPNYNIRTNTNESTVAEKHFNQMTAGNIMKVSYMHPTKDTFFWTDADAFVDYAASKGINVHAHTLIWHSSYQVPDFIKNWTGTPTEFLAMLDTHVDTIVKHFTAKPNVVSWDVVNEALTDSSPSDFRTDSPFYIKSGNSAVYLERAFSAARAANATVDLFYNDYNIEQNGAKMTKLAAMIDDFQNRSIPITGIGFQMHVSMDYPPISAISSAMQKVVDRKLKVKISELDVAVNNPYSSGWPGNKISLFSSDVALNQKKRYCEIVKAYLDTVPQQYRAGITLWGISDVNTWLDGQTSLGGTKTWPLLFDDNYQEKPALKGFADALNSNACTNLP